MKFKAEINIMPRAELLDPQGKAVKLGLGNLGVENVEDVRIGKRITVALEAASEDKAREQLDLACEKLLANVIMEEYTYELVPA